MFFCTLPAGPTGSGSLRKVIAFGHLYNTTVPEIAGAKAFRKLYNAPLNEEGARKVAHEYAADVLNQFGVPSLAGSKIYFVSDRGGKGMKEIWSMDFDGANQRRLTQFNSISTMPAVSPDGQRLAFTTYAKGQPRIEVMSLETMRFLPAEVGERKVRQRVVQPFQFTLNR